MIERSRVLGGTSDLELLLGQHKVSEVFVALPEADEEMVMTLVSALERERGRAPSSFILATLCTAASSPTQRSSEAAEQKKSAAQHALHSRDQHSLRLRPIT